MKKTIMSIIAALTTWMVLTAVTNLGVSMWVHAFGMKLYTLYILGAVTKWMIPGAMVAAAVITWMKVGKKAGKA